MNTKKRVMWHVRKVLDYGTIAIGLLTLLYGYTVGFYKIVNVPTKFQVLGCFVVPLILLLAIASMLLWIQERRNRKDFASVWLFLSGLFGPILIAWCRPWSPTLYEYRFVPFILPVAAIVLNIVYFGWTRSRYLLYRWRMRPQLKTE